MSLEENDSIEVSFRILGSEVLGFRMTVDDFKVKWMLLGLTTTAAFAWMADYLGLL